MSGTALKTSRLSGGRFSTVSGWSRVITQRGMVVETGRALKRCAGWLAIRTALTPLVTRRGGRIIRRGCMRCFGRGAVLDPVAGCLRSGRGLGW